MISSGVGQFSPGHLDGIRKNGVMTVMTTAATNTVIMVTRPKFLRDIFICLLVNIGELLYDALSCLSSPRCPWC